MPVCKEKDDITLDFSYTGLDQARGKESLNNTCYPSPLKATISTNNGTRLSFCGYLVAYSLPAPNAYKVATP